MEYIIEMNVNGEWKVWNRTDDKERAELMYKTARCYGECRLIEK